MTLHTPDLGVPAARNARIYAVAALAVTAVIGLVVWDLVGILLGLPLAIIGLVKSARSWRPTAEYPRDRRALVVAFAATAGWVLLASYIGSQASDSGAETSDDRHAAFCANSLEVTGELAPALSAADMSPDETQAAIDRLLDQDDRLHSAAVERLEFAPAELLDQARLVDSRLSNSADTGDDLANSDLRSAVADLEAYTDERCSGA